MRRRPGRSLFAAARASCAHPLLAAALAACGGPPSGDPTPLADATASEQARLDQLRSLPYLDFVPKPAMADERDGVVLLDSARAWPGYSLYTVRAFCLAELIDLRGRVVRSWRSRPCGRWSQADLLPDGSLLVINSEKRKRSLMKLAWNGKLLWKRTLAVHHDVERTPAGPLLTLTMADRQVRHDGAVHLIRDDLLTLLDDDGAVLDTLSLFDVLGADPAQKILRWTNARSGSAVDLFHANSIEWLRPARDLGPSPIYGPGNVLVSIRHQDIVAIIDWKRQRLVWWWGRGELSGQHDATLLDNGHVLVFDNGLGRGWSRIVEVDPVSNRIVWEYRADPPESFDSASLGGAQRLPNGNTLIANSYSGEAFEVAPDGQVVWRFVTPSKNPRRERASLIRMKRYSREMIEPLLATPTTH